MIVVLTDSDGRDVTIHGVVESGGGASLMVQINKGRRTIVRSLLRVSDQDARLLASILTREADQ